MQTGSREALPSARSEATRAALVRAALDLFGARGYEATSTREIAAAAEANIAAIAYHFGGKEGLRLACADFVVATISEVLADALGEAGRIEALSPDAARDLLARFVSAMIDGIVAATRRGRSPASWCARCSSLPPPSSGCTPASWADTRQGLPRLVARDRRAGRKRRDPARRLRTDRADHLLPPRAPRGSAAHGLARHRTFSSLGHQARGPRQSRRRPRRRPRRDLARKTSP